MKWALKASRARLRGLCHDVTQHMQTRELATHLLIQAF